MMNKALASPKLGAAIEQLAQALPETIDRVRELVKAVSDDRVKLKLEIMRNNLRIYESKLAMVQALMESGHELSEELMRDVFAMANKLVDINYDLADVVGSTTRGQGRSKVVEALVDLAKKHPELLALPFGGATAAAVYAGRKLLGSSDESRDGEPDED